MKVPDMSLNSGRWKNRKISTPPPRSSLTSLIWKCEKNIDNIYK